MLSKYTKYHCHYDGCDKSYVSKWRLRNHFNFNHPGIEELILFILTIFISVQISDTSTNQIVSQVNDSMDTKFNQSNSEISLAVIEAIQLKIGEEELNNIFHERSKSFVSNFAGHFNPSCFFTFL